MPSPSMKPGVSTSGLATGIPRATSASVVTVHQVGDGISGVQEDPAESTNRLLAASFVTGDGNAFNGSQDAVEVAHHLAHRDLLRRLGQTIAAPQARQAFHPPPLLEREHDLLEEFLGDIVPPGQLPDRNRSTTKVVDKREQRAERIIRLL